MVLKLNSETITHKSDVGGVQLNLKDDAAVRQAFELIRATREPSRPAKATSTASPFNR